MGRAMEATRRSLLRHPMTRGVRTVAVLGLGGALLVAACGGDDGEAKGPLIVEAGYVDVQLPEDLQLETTDPSAATGTDDDGAPVDPTAPGGATGDVADDETSEDTIPLEESDEPASAKLLKALGIFNACLEDEGVEFIGAPSPDNPATNDPAYVDGLSTCAARSNIVQALAAAESENENLSPEEIQERNESYLLWRDCMIDRGWRIPEPVPDAEGRLFSFGGGGDGGSQLEPPPGENLLDSGDLAECADQASRELEGQ